MRTNNKPTQNGGNIMTIRNISKILLVAALLVFVGLASVQADNYPSKPITLIIPLGACGSHDLNARVFTSVIPAYLGQAVVIKLMPGAGGKPAQLLP
jgi:tripartite-type tricarboxylate transporter receptor subunit TctC